MAESDGLWLRGQLPASASHPRLTVRKESEGWEQGVHLKYESMTTDCDIFHDPQQTCKVGRVGITSPFCRQGN